MTSPSNVSERCGTDDIIQFSGYTLGSAQDVSVEAATSFTGPWVEIATSVSSNSSIELGGVLLYAWSVQAQIPTWVSTGGVDEAYVRARLPGGALFTTFDNAATSGTVSGIECVLSDVIGGDDLATAVSHCQSPDSPVVRVTAPSVSTCPCPPGIVHVGDVVIDDAADLVTFECTETIQGNLEVPLGVFLDVELPELQEVTGNVTIDLNFAGPQTQRNVDFAGLATIGGDVSVEWDDITVPGPTIDIGLDAVTSLGGDVTIDIHSVNYNLRGLQTLVTMPGSMSIVGSSGDVTSSSFATNLQEIGGDLLFEPGYTVSWMFPALQTVGGDLTIDGGFWIPNSGFGALDSVGGSMNLLSMQTAPVGPMFDALTSVGGILTIQDTELYLLSHFVPLPVSVGGLVLDLDPNLETLDGSWSVDPAGPITITDNLALDTCDAEAFVADQIAAGWAGVSTISGNAGASCP